MAEIYGQIESLKRIRNHLRLKGIDRFNSINEINTFLKNYESEKIIIYKYFENELENDIHELKEKIKYNHDASEKIKKESIKKLDTKISLNLNILDKYYKKDKNSFLAKYFTQLIVKLLDARVKYLQNNYENIISKSTNKIKSKINRDIKKLKEFIGNKEDIITERSAKKIRQLAYTKEVILELNPLIAGAVGENLVVNEIKKLSNDYILINDFSLAFDPPIYNKKENDRIYSIQIDHLLISKSGVYILETKNWSKKSIMSFGLRSPIEQINRTSFALFVLLNTKNHHKKIKLKKHHWGEKQIPIRNIIVMINNKPKEKFKFAKIKTLKELNTYIEFFDPIFNDNEYSNIFRNLIDLYHKNNITANNAKKVWR
jgi:nuclease-like protein